MANNDRMVKEKKGKKNEFYTRYEDIEKEMNAYVEYNPNVFRDKGIVEIQAVGAGAINQAIKAIAIARGFVAPNGKNLVCIPAFSDISIDGEERTAIKLIVEAK